MYVLIAHTVSRSEYKTGACQDLSARVWLSDIAHFLSLDNQCHVKYKKEVHTLQECKDVPLSLHYPVLAFPVNTKQQTTADVESRVHMMIPKDQLNRTCKFV